VVNPRGELTNTGQRTGNDNDREKHGGICSRSFIYIFVKERLTAHLENGTYTQIYFGRETRKSFVEEVVGAARGGGYLGGKGGGGSGWEWVGVGREEERERERGREKERGREGERERGREGESSEQ
jgi:hypothetical protein